MNGDRARYLTRLVRVLRVLSRDARLTARRCGARADGPATMPGLLGSARSAAAGMLALRTE